MTKWVVLNTQNAIVGLVDLTKDRVKPADLPKFFWKHLQCDVDVLAKAVGRSRDDACLLLHLVLKQISTKNPPQCKPVLLQIVIPSQVYKCPCIYMYMYIASGIKTCASLLAREARAKWESDFNTAYIQQLMVVSSAVHFNTAIRHIQNSSFFKSS